MMLAPSVARARWANFVTRAVRDARGRGMTDAAINKATGVGMSTIYRWQTTEGGLPQFDKVVNFCVGLEIPPGAAFAAMGASAAPPPVEPELDPDLKRIGRILNDPRTSDEDRDYIRRTLRVMASIGTRRG